jgi:hypothetical protein
MIRARGSIGVADVPEGSSLPSDAAVISSASAPPIDSGEPVAQACTPLDAREAHHDQGENAGHQAEERGRH